MRKSIAVLLGLGLTLLTAPGMSAAIKKAPAKKAAATKGSTEKDPAGAKASKKPDQK